MALTGCIGKNYLWFSDFIVDMFGELNHGVE